MATEEKNNDNDNEISKLKTANKITLFIALFGVIVTALNTFDGMYIRHYETKIKTINEQESKALEHRQTEYSRLSLLIENQKKDAAEIESYLINVNLLFVDASHICIGQKDTSTRKKKLEKIRDRIYRNAFNIIKMQNNYLINVDASLSSVGSVKEINRAQLNELRTYISNALKLSDTLMSCPSEVRSSNFDYELQEKRNAVERVLILQGIKTVELRKKYE